MGSIGISQKNLGLALLVGLGLQYVRAFNLPKVGLLIILIVAIILFLK